MGLKDEIDTLLRESVQATTFGMLGWVEGTEGVKRRYDQMDVATRDQATREYLFAMSDGHTAAIRRLAQEIEEHGR